VNDFADENKLVAYFGIVPRVSDSNETDILDVEEWLDI
jgi:hypothetical protein